MNTLAGISPEAERRWDLNWLDGQSVLMVRPRLLDGIAIHAGQYYDTTLASVVDQRIVAHEVEGWSTTMPRPTPQTLFCAMSLNEYAAVCRSGQMPEAAVLVDDALRAVSTQWANAPTFEHPVIVASVTVPMPARGGGLTSVITAVHVGRPYRIEQGRISMTQIDNQWTEGDRQSPSAWLVWKAIPPGTPVASEPHVYRLGWCLTCGTPRYDCGSSKSGNFGHKGVAGQRGGSAPGELSSAGDALHSLLNGERVNIAKEEVRDFVEKARDQDEDPDLTDVHVEGMLIFGGNGLGIARADMPQIPQEHREPFLEHLESKGIKVKTESVSPLTLAPTQKEISARNVGEKLHDHEKNPKKKFPPLLVAEDNHVLDGHHHWGAMATVAIDNPDVKVPIHRIMTTPKKALEIMHAYDKKHGIERKALAHTPTKDKRKIAASERFALGGAGSGNFGHEGRPGEVGGSGGDGGGGGSEAALTAKGTGESLKVPASESPDFGADRPTPRQVENVADAVAAIIKGEVIEIKEVRDVHTVLSKLAAMAKDAKAKGEKAPKYDLCNVSVAGSNLFCGSVLKTKEFPNGVPRIHMPQMAGTPVPGSRADSMPKNEKGHINATKEFIAELKSKGIATKAEQVPAAHLRATQAQLGGPTVAGMMTDTTFDPGKDPIFISSDNYVLDGHHRWAAQVGRDAEDGKLGDSHMNVVRVDAPISELFHRANRFTKEIGIADKAVKLRRYAAKVYALAGWEEGEHPRDDSGKFDESGGGGGAAPKGGANGTGRTSETTGHAGWTAAPKSVPGGTSTASGGTSSSAASSSAGSTDGKPTGPTTTADATGAGPLKPPASLFKIADKMPPDERAALDMGYKSSQLAGFKGTIEDFFSEQVALYKHAPEGDPRIKTWFYGGTMEAVEQDPEAKAHIAKVVAKQQEPKPEGKPTPAIGDVGGPEREGLEGIVFKETGVDYGASPHVPIPEGDGEDEHKGGGGGKKKEGAELKDAQALLAKLKPGTPEYLAQKKKVDALAAGGKKKGKAAKGPGSTGAVTGPKGPGEAGAVGANAEKIMGKMKPDERKALDAGYAAAQKAGFDGTMDDYFVQQVALYQHAPEGDPRLTTFLYGETLSRAQGDSALWQQVQTVIAQQQGAPAKLFWDRLRTIALGGEGSGNFNHEGRPGEVGGSGGGGGSSAGESKPSWQTKGVREAIGRPDPLQPHLPEPTHPPQALANARALVEQNAPVDAVLDALDGNARAQFAALRTQGEKANGELKAIVQELAESLPGDPEVKQGPVKGLDRSVAKVIGKDTGDARNVRDVVRASVAVDTVEELGDAVKAVEDAFVKAGGAIVTADDRFAKPLASGYRDLQLTVRLPSGVIGEVQVHLKPILEAKDRRGHKIYQEARKLNEREKLTPADHAELQRLFAESKELYDTAWKEAGGK